MRQNPLVRPVTESPDNERTTHYQLPKQGLHLIQSYVRGPAAGRLVTGEEI